MTDVSKSPERISGMFDAIARRYDLLNHVLSGGIDRRWRAKAVRALGLTGRERMLDVCAGTADLAIAARRARPPVARVVGVDFSQAMLRVGDEKLRREGLDRTISLVRGDAMRLPIADRSVDVVTVAFGIRNVASITAALGDMHRVLVPGGRLAILEFAVPPNPVVRELYGWYSRHVLPRIGRLLSRHNDAYGYLPASIAAFESPQEVVRLLNDTGFSQVRADSLTLGLVYLYVGVKQTSI